MVGDLEQEGAVVVLAVSLTRRGVYNSVRKVANKRVNVRKVF